MYVTRDEHRGDSGTVWSRGRARANNNYRGSRSHHRPQHRRDTTKRRLLRNLDRERQFLFIHVPKTGGSSLERLPFGRSLDSEHVPLRECMAWSACSASEWRRLFKFGFVRNPYLRSASIFLYFKAGGNQKHDRWKMSTLFAALRGLDDFVDFVRACEHPRFAAHEFFADGRLTQTRWLHGTPSTLSDGHRIRTHRAKCVASLIGDRLLCWSLLEVTTNHEGDGDRCVCVIVCITYAN